MKRTLLALLLVMLMLTACTKEVPTGISQEDYDLVTDELAAANENVLQLEADIEQLEEALVQCEAEATETEMLILGPVPGASLMSEAVAIVELLQSEDFTTLALYIDPADGLRLSPYQYVDTASDVVMSPSDVADWSTYPSTLWGSYDGTGDPITLTGIDYFDKFVYDEDYAIAPFIGQNAILSFGNIINNITTVYAGDSYVEFYFDGFNPAYTGMDWSSLTLVMRNIGGQWYLVGLVNGQWTI